jgi:hypothetical protein
VLAKSFQLLAGLSLLASVSIVAAPVQAQTLGDLPKINLMTGHPMLKMIQEMDPEAVAIGRVVGRAGTILSVSFINAPVTVGDQDFYSVRIGQPNWHTLEGNDVILAYKDGAWVFVDEAACMMSWISRLNLKEPAEVQAIEWGESKPVAIPPQPAPRVVAPAPEPEPAPIRGLW